MCSHLATAWPLSCGLLVAMNLWNLLAVARVASDGGLMCVCVPARCKL